MWQHTRSTQKNKSEDLIYTNDKGAEKEIRETLPFTITTNNIKYFGVPQTKEMKDLYDKSFKPLKNEKFTVDTRHIDS